MFGSILDWAIKKKVIVNHVSFSSLFLFSITKLFWCWNLVCFLNYAHRDWCILISVSITVQKHSRSSNPTSEYQHSHLALADTRTLSKILFLWKPNLAPSYKHISPPFNTLRFLRSPSLIFFSICIEFFSLFSFT